MVLNAHIIETPAKATNKNKTKLKPKYCSTSLSRYEIDSIESSSKQCDVLITSFAVVEDGLDQLIRPCRYTISSSQGGRRSKLVA